MVTWSRSPRTVHSRPRRRPTNPAPPPACTWTPSPGCAASPLSRCSWSTPPGAPTTPGWVSRRSARCACSCSPATCSSGSGCRGCSAPVTGRPWRPSPATACSASSRRTGSCSLVAALALPVSRPTGADGWIRSLLLGQTFSSTGLRPGMEHVWSLGTEVTWYLVLPVLALGTGLLVRRRSGPARARLVVAVLLLAVPLTAGFRIWTSASGLGRPSPSRSGSRRSPCASASVPWWRPWWAPTVPGS